MENESLRINLVAALLECHYVSDRSLRDGVVRLLPQDLRSRIRRSDIDRVDVIGIVSACCDWEGGLDNLVEAVRQFESDKSIPFKKALKIYKQIKSQSDLLLASLDHVGAPSSLRPSEISFEALIRGWCDQIGWNITEIGDDYALLRFDMPTGCVQTVWLVPYESTMEFSVPSTICFDAESDLPHFLSTALLLRNAIGRYGFWTIQQAEDKWHYSCMYKAEKKLMDAPNFKTAVEALIGECDALEQLLNKDAEEEGEGRTDSRWLDFPF